MISIEIKALDCIAKSESFSYQKLHNLYRMNIDRKSDFYHWTLTSIQN